MTLIWTVLPLEQVFENYGVNTPTYQTIQYLGVTMLVRQGESGTGTVERVLSLDPQDYLHPECQPGSVIRLPFERM